MESQTQWHGSAKLLYRASTNDLAMYDPDAEVSDIEAFGVAMEGHIPYPLHCHDYLELIYVQNNCDLDYLVAGKRYVLHRGDVLMIPPGVAHTPSHASMEPVFCYLIWIGKAWLDQLLVHLPYLKSQENLQNWKVSTADTVWESIGDDFRTAAYEKKLKAPGSDAAITGLIISLLAKLTRAVEAQKDTAFRCEASELLDQVLAYLESVLFEPFKLPDVAKRFRVSESTLGHLFTQKLGISFYRYVLQRRLHEAKNLLKEDIPMEQVSSLVGFQDYSTFYRAFKREFGITPKEYRQRKYV